MGTIIFALVVFLIASLVFSLVFYVFMSLGLYKLGKKEEEETYPLAWIPYANQYLVGKLAFDSKVHAIIMLTINLFILLLSLFIIFICRNEYVMYIVSLLDIVLSMISSVYTLVAHYKIYSKYSKSTVIMTILDVISLDILGPLFIFAIRNNELKEN